MSSMAQYDKYLVNQIMTASPAELTLMLYNGAIKFGMIAIMGIEEGNIQKAHDNIKRVEAIIQEFQITLDRNIPVSEAFDDVYNYMITRLRQANIEKSIPIMEEVLDHLRTMRDTWKEVMKSAHS